MNFDKIKKITGAALVAGNILTVEPTAAQQATPERLELFQNDLKKDAANAESFLFELKLLQQFRSHMKSLRETAKKTQELRRKIEEMLGEKAKTPEDSDAIRRFEDACTAEWLENTIRNTKAVINVHKKIASEAGLTKELREELLALKKEEKKLLKQVCTYQGS